MQDLNKAGEVRRASAPIQILQGGNIYWETEIRWEESDGVPMGVSW